MNEKSTKFLVIIDGLYFSKNGRSETNKSNLKLNDYSFQIKCQIPRQSLDKARKGTRKVLEYVEL